MICVLVGVLILTSFGEAEISEALVENLPFEINLSDFECQELLPADLPSENGTYDFIIVGAGTAGSVLANRLSENPNWTVYLLEAGGRENKAHDIPALTTLLPLTNSNWGHKSVPQKNACYGMNDQVCALPKGKCLGGSSCISYMIHSRGNCNDFDRWADAGNKGWSCSDVLPFFKRSEMARLNGLENSEYHNTTGPLSVEHVAYRTEILEGFVKGAQEAGHKLIDHNGESQIGVSYVQANTKTGHRQSTAKAYLEPVKSDRKNLHILTYATVTKILIDPETKSAYGVEFLHKNNKYSIRARKEVILSAGAFNSPQLLMLSGIGPKEVLESIRVPLIKELPVGKVLYDHISFIGPVFTVNTTGQSLFPQRLTPGKFAKFENDDPSTIFSTIGGVESSLFIKTSNSKQPPGVPDAELVMISTSLAGDYGMGLKVSANIRDDIYDKMFKPMEGLDHFGFLILLLHPESFGFLTLGSSDPKEFPIIDPNYLEIGDDLEPILEGIKAALRISKTLAMQKINTTLNTIPTPGCEDLEFGTDDYWRCSIRTLSYTLHHQVGTCKMGVSTDPTAVVDHNLKVFGIKNLRVVDAGIMPTITSSHISAATVMIAEKAANMIKDEHQASS